MQLQNRTAVITGGARGLGKLYALTLLDRGAKVAILDILKKTGEETCREFNDKFGPDVAIFVCCDVSNRQQFQDALDITAQSLGTVDILINNAGILGVKEEDYEQTVAVNLIGAINGTLLAAEKMNMETGGSGGVIVNISSILGVEVMPCLPAYHASKHGIIGFSKSYARMIGDQCTTSGVRVNVLAPSTVKSDMTQEQKADAFNIDPDIFMKYGGFNEPTDVAKAMLRAIEDETLHGAVMVVHSGRIEYQFPPALQGTQEQLNNILTQP